MKSPHSISHICRVRIADSIPLSHGRKQNCRRDRQQKQQRSSGEAHASGHRASGWSEAIKLVLRKTNMAPQTDHQKMIEDTIAFVAQARWDPLSRDRCSNTPVALCFFQVSQLITAVPHSGPTRRQKGPIAAKGLCKGRGITFYSGVFGVSRFWGVL